MIKSKNEDKLIILSIGVVSSEVIHSNPSSRDEGKFLIDELTKLSTVSIPMGGTLEPVGIVYRKRKI